MFFNRIYLTDMITVRRSVFSILGSKAASATTRRVCFQPLPLVVLDIGVDFRADSMMGKKSTHSEHPREKPSFDPTTVSLARPALAFNRCGNR